MPQSPNSALISPDAASHPTELDKSSLASAIDQTADAILITNPFGIIQYVNPAFTRMTGYSAAEAIGQNPRMLKSSRQDARSYDDLWNTIRAGHPWHGELLNQRKDGTHYTEEMSVTPVRDRAGEIARYIAIKKDVTGRREAEDAHRFLASIVESTHDAVVGHTPDGRIMTWNRAAEELHGYRPEEVIGKSVEMLIAPESLERVRQVVAGLARGEVCRQLESVVLRKNGDRVHVQVTLSIITDAAGRVTASAAIVRDISQRKRAEQAIQDSEERFRTIFEYAPFGMCVSTPDARLLRANAAFGQMVGYTQEELIARGWMSITHPDDRAISLAHCARLLRDRPPCVDFEKRYLRKDRTVMWARVRISLLPAAADPQPRLINHVEDITEQKCAREALLRSQEKYRRLLANLPDVAWSSNLRAQTTYISPNVESVIGFTPAEICERAQELWFGRIHPDDRERVLAEYQALFAGLRPFDVEYRLQRKDGRWIWLHDRAMRTYEDDGGLCTDGVFSDITARRFAEEALAESEARYRLLFERNLAGVFRALPGGRLVECNEALLRILGYDSVAEFVAQPAAALFYDPADRQATHERLYRERTLTNHDVRLKRKDGTPVWVLENVSLAIDEYGQPAFIETTLFDITARKRAEQAMRESEEKYRTLVTHIPDVVWTADAEGQPVFVSPNCEATFGYTPEEMCRPGFWRERIHLEDREKRRGALAEFMANGRPYDVEYRVHRKDGRTIWVHNRAFHSYEKGGIRYADGCASDVSEQKAAAQLIGQLQHRTELILNSAGEGIVGLDPEGRLTFANPAAARMLGSTPEELIGQEFRRMAGHRLADGSECPGVECGIVACLHDGKEHRGADDRFQPAGVPSFPVEYTSTPKFDGGRISGAVVVFRDITEARRARQRIEASLKEKEALLREIHHRVKNNLQIVCSLLKLNSQSLRDPEALHVFEDTRHRVKAMALVHETLYRSGDLAGINFSEYVPRLAEQLLHAYGLSRGQAAIAFHVEPLVLPIDTAIPCALMLTELVSNAAKHVLVVIPGSRLGITLRRLDETSCLLRVENSALPGAAPRPAAGARSSFGLELVKLLTEQLGGTVTIEPQPDFRVSVVFPLAASDGGAS